jgi:hypothetical protein
MIFGKREKMGPGEQLQDFFGNAIGSRVPMAPKTSRIADGVGGYFEFTTDSNNQTTRQHYDQDNNPTSPSSSNFVATKTIGGVKYYQDADGAWHK